MNVLSTYNPNLFVVDHLNVKVQNPYRNAHLRDLQIHASPDYVSLQHTLEHQIFQSCPLTNCTQLLFSLPHFFRTFSTTLDYK